MAKISLNLSEYFLSMPNPMQRQYLAMRMFFAEGASAEEVASRYGYTANTVYTYVRRFKEKMDSSDEDPFFKESQVGRKRLDHGGGVNDLIVAFRKKNFSVPEIKAALDAQGICVSERYISSLLTDEGFARLPRRDNKERSQVDFNGVHELCHAPASEAIPNEPDKFSSQMAGILMFLPIIKDYGIDRLIEFSSYPESKVINRLSSILSFLALKLSDIERYSMDDAWCMDRGMGLFAGLNVLPKTAWFSSY
jgi:transposase